MSKDQESCFLANHLSTGALRFQPLAFLCLELPMDGGAADVVAILLNPAQP